MRNFILSTFSALFLSFFAVGAQEVRFYFIFGRYFAHLSSSVTYSWNVLYRQRSCYSWWRQPCRNLRRWSTKYTNCYPADWVRSSTCMTGNFNPQFIVHLIGFFCSGSSQTPTQMARNLSYLLPASPKQQQRVITLLSSIQRIPLCGQSRDLVVADIIREFFRLHVNVVKC